MTTDRRWTVQDRYGNQIYLTQERWEHIIELLNHPEIEVYEEYIKTTLQKGRRKQEAFDPYKYRYYHFFDDLPDDVNAIIVIVLFRFNVNAEGYPLPNNFVTTAFFKHIRAKR